MIKKMKYLPILLLTSCATLNAARPLYQVGQIVVIPSNGDIWSNCPATVTHIAPIDTLKTANVTKAGNFWYVLYVKNCYSQFLAKENLETYLTAKLIVNEETMVEIVKGRLEKHLD